MNGLPTGFSGWIWWIISVVVVGILINLLSSYLYPKMQIQAAKNSSKRQHELEEKRIEYANLVNKIKTNPPELMEIKIDLILLNLRMVIIIVAGISILVILPLVFRLNFFTSFIFVVPFIIMLLSLVLPLLSKSLYYSKLIFDVSKNP